MAVQSMVRMTTPPLNQFLLAIAAAALVACGQGKAQSTTPATTDIGDEQAVTPGADNDNPDPASAPDRDGEQGNVFQLGDSDTAGEARGVNPSQVKPTRTEAAMRLFVLDKENKPIDGVVIALIAPDGTKYFTEETDAKGYAEVLVPVGKTYQVSYLSLGRKDITAKVEVADKPSLNVKLTLRYNREEYAQVGKDGPGFVLKGVQFETGKATLTKDSFARLDSVLEFMTHKQSARIQISGHTDNVGNPKSNKKLSQRRAEAVKKYLVSKGIAGDRIETVGYGDERPVASNDTDEGRQINRRIEAIEL